MTAGGTTSADAYDAFLQGLGYLDRPAEPGHVDRAIDRFERALTLDPAYALAHSQLGEAYVRHFRESRDERWLVRAEAAGREALALAPETSDVHALLSKVARNRGDAQAALASARRAVRLDPASDAATFALGAAYDLAGDGAGAERTYRLAVRRKRGSWSARMVLGKHYLDRGRYADAEVVYRAAVPLAPDNTDLLNAHGAALLYLQQDARARAVFERSVRVRPTYGALSNLGWIDQTEGRTANAALYYERALSLNNADPLVWGNLASAYEELGRTTDGLRATREGTRRAESQLVATPHDGDLLVTLAGFYADLGRAAAARRAARRAAALAPTVDAQADLAAVLARTGDATAGCRWIRQALDEGFPRDEAESDSTLAVLLRGCGDPSVP